ncbi:MAG: hypothetical protein PHW53_04370 [Patescibacteria group bacterium]|nr:hypothetical protein [Patescibacteria group bacterium]
MKPILRILQAIIILAPLGLVAWLFNLNFVPSGVLARSFNFSDASPYADFLVPAQRVTGVMNEDSVNFQQILDEPVYFHVHLPSAFDKLTVGVKFKPDTQPFLEFGPMITEAAWQYDLRPLWNKILEEINWITLEAGGLRLYERQDKYRSVQEFLDNPPSMDEVAVYNYSLPTSYRIPDYEPWAAEREYEIYLRGYHQFLTYIGNGEKLDFSFLIQDMNRGEGADPVVVNLYKDGALADSLVIPDGELWRPAQQGSALRTVELKKDNLSEGVYKIEFKAPSDIFIRKIITPQQKCVIVNTAFLGDEVGYAEPELPAELWTNSSYIVAQTLHADGTQELGAGDETLRVAESFREYYKELGNSAGLKRVYSPQGDIKITGNGLFAWNRDLFFNPFPVKLDANTDLDAQGINFVLTNYKNAVRDGDWYFAEQTFDLSRVPSPGGTIKFSISAPGVARTQAAPAIGGIDLILEREPITWENWASTARMYFEKLKNNIFSD